MRRAPPEVDGCDAWGLRPIPQTEARPRCPVTPDGNEGPGALETVILPCARVSSWPPGVRAIMRCGLR